ncbi:MAG: ECF-type sigma factor [Gemmatimonadaceae bacterium]
MLRSIDQGQHEIVHQVVPLVYDELRLMARRQLSHQRPGHTLSTTGLVHEAYLKLASASARPWHDRAHFLSVAAVVMRHILVNYARAQHAQKRGDGQTIVTLDDAMVGGELRSEELLLLDDALERLDAANPRQRAVVEYRFFGGLTHEEIASVLGISVPTVQRDWRMARAWLARELKGAKT